ncbi:MAG TPA: response regulator transcription factor [Anaerolineae bacterium]|nr:response regulator transcription factor [Anaerolineae bacterium]
MSQRILVVDDDRQIVRLIRSYLEQNGYETLAAYEGNEALHLIRVGPIRLDDDRHVVWVGDRV